jgi:hypothetical protein
MATLLPKKATLPTRPKAKSYFHRAIRRVLHQIHPTIGISRRSVTLLNTLVREIAKSIGRECIRLAQFNRKQKPGVREVYLAVRLLVPELLAGHAISDARKAVVRLSES